MHVSEHARMCICVGEFAQLEDLFGNIIFGWREQIMKATQSAEA